MSTGTVSLTDAYRTLGYNAHHGMDDVFGSPWASLEKAAETTFPSLVKLPGYTYSSSFEPRPSFTREELVQRPFEAWWPSIWTALLTPALETYTSKEQQKRFPSNKA